MPLTGFNYDTKGAGRKAPKKTGPEGQPAASKTPVNQAEIDAMQHPTAPKEPFGTGLRERPPVPPAPDEKVERQFEFGGSSGGTAQEPVEVPPEQKPAGSVRARPKTPEIKVQSPHGSDTEGYLEDGPETEVESVHPDEDSGAAPSKDAADVVSVEDDREAMARLEDEAYGTGSGQAAKRQAQPGRKQAGKRGRSVRNKQQDQGDGADVARLKYLPRCLVELCRDAFPGAQRQEDAVAAYIFFREGMPSDLDVPEDIARLARTYSGETVTAGTVKDVVERDISDLKVMNRDLSRKLDAIELATIYAIFEAVGLRKADTVSPETIDFLEHGIADMMKRLEAQSELKRQRDRQREGRPIR